MWSHPSICHQRDIVLLHMGLNRHTRTWIFPVSRFTGEWGLKLRASEQNRSTDYVGWPQLLWPPPKNLFKLLAYRIRETLETLNCSAVLCNIYTILQAPSRTTQPNHSLQNGFPRYLSMYVLLWVNRLCLLIWVTVLLGYNPHSSRNRRKRVWMGKLECMPSYTWYTVRFCAKLVISLTLCYLVAVVAGWQTCSNYGFALRGS